MGIKTPPPLPCSAGTDECSNRVLREMSMVHGHDQVAWILRSGGLTPYSHKICPHFLAHRPGSWKL